MIKIFCDCCGKEILEKILVGNKVISFPFKRVSIGKYSSDKSLNGDFREDYLIKLVVIASICKPRDLRDDLATADYIGNCICKDCIKEVLAGK